MIFHWLFIISTLIFCAVAAMPTRGWLSLAGWFKGTTLRWKQKRLQEAFAAQPQPFSADESFLDRGVGLAVDHARRLVFLAVPDGARMQAEILPSSAVGAHAARMRSDNGFQEHFVDISAPGTACPSWRLHCGDAALAAEVDGALSRL